ncbi:MAG: DNA replication protein DnaC [Ruminococcaceae bacterium]|nr:DNA replication protein DnaC [Oscillospiraceae bacterium]
MGYDGKILARATEKYGQLIARHERELDQRAALLEGRFPRLKEIDTLLRRSVIQAIHAALSAGSDAGDQVRIQQKRNLALQEERGRILTEQGYPATFLDREALCPLCGDTGYRESGMCQCLAKVYREEQNRELHETTGMKPMYLHEISFETYSDQRTGGSVSARENMQYTVSRCEAIIRERGGRGNFFFSGPPGSGKTHVAVCMGYSAAAAGISVVYETAGRLLSRYEDARFRRDDETARAEIARCENCDLLILDDLGTEMTSSVSNASLYQLLSTRLTAGRGCVFITNQPYEELRRRYPPQILSRFEGEFQVMRFFGTDLRQNKRGNFY